jgi:ADP-ribose pyrophosphatase YjhB (NUDIX family)
VPEPQPDDATAREPSHAGGVVYREGTGGAFEVLLVRPSSGADEWVLPKGHVETGEATAATAVREVAEEAGVEASIVAPLGRLEQPSRSGPALVAWFLMRFERTVPPLEARETRWFAVEEACERATLEPLREVLRAASRRLGRS